MHLRAIHSKSAWVPIVLLLALLAFAIKVWLAFGTYGTNDVLVWEASAERIGISGPIAAYQQPLHLTWRGELLYMEKFNHPAFIAYALSAADLVTKSTGLPIRVLLRLICAFADLVSLCVVYLLIGYGPTLALFAVCPILLVVSGYHGNTDPILLMFLLLATWSWEARRSVILTSLFLGMAINIKLVPALLIPIFLFAMPDHRRRAILIGVIGVVVTIPALPILIKDPELYIRQVLLYQGLTGHWGLTFLVPSTAAPVGVKVFRIASVVIFPVIAWALERYSSCSIFDRVGFCLFLLVFVSPVFAVQYLVWLAPWVVALGPFVVGTFYAISGYFLIWTYHLWNGSRWPWDFANSVAYGGLHNGPNLRGLIVWSFIPVVLYLYIERFYSESDTKRHGTLSPKIGDGRI